MPELQKIVIQNFRNIELQEVGFSSNINCISGGNGEGKTNLLDAIWYLSMTKSAFSTSDKYNFRYGTDTFALGGTYKMRPDSDAASHFSIIVKDGAEKKLRKDDKPYNKISDHIGVLPIVMVSPSDISLVSESGEERRKFANAVLSQMDREYLSDIQQYNRLLLQRNKLLKAGVFDEDLLSTYDERMSTLAVPIFEKREKFCKSLIPVVQHHYKEISSGKENVGIRYISDLYRGKLSDILRSKRERDAAFHFTTAGIQRDDFVFEMNGMPIRRCGSQGQQKSFLVSLKFAQHEVMREAYGYPPIMLLDDLFDKLDSARVGNLLKMVSGREFGQIFITDSNKVRIEGIIDRITSERAYITAQGGVFTKTDE